MPGVGGKMRASAAEAGEGPGKCTVQAGQQWSLNLPNFVEGRKLLQSGDRKWVQIRTEGSTTQHAGPGGRV